ncbi:hypothetical protein [Paraburkholderia dilworthii]|nr:hypothetical protein [Paraburkholderia dilworthii]
MSQDARDLTELRREYPASPELRKIASALIGAGVKDEREGC